MNQEKLSKFISLVYFFSSTYALNVELIFSRVCVFASKAAVFELRHLTIRLPALLPFHKCLLCQKFYKPEVIGEHLLSHFHISSQKCKRILLWFSKFLESEEGRIIEKCYNDYFDKAKKVDSTSTLLERLPMFETRKTNICRFCKIRVSNTSDLYAHYAEWHAISRIEEWNCVICNFMAPSKEGLLNHFHSKHIFCVFCRTKFANFVECLSHMKRCWKTYCPFCKIRFVNECGIVDFQALMKHINKGKKEPMCPHCKMNFNGFKSLKYHLDDCPERTPAGVFCPCCRQKQFTNIDTFNDHILKCLPWLAPEVNLPCINGTQKRSGIPRKDNLIKFSDVERYLEPMIILEKSVNGSTSFSK